MDKELIVISVPTTQFSYTAPLAATIRGLERQSENRKHGFKFTANIVNGYQTVAHARNRLVQLFLENKKASRIWFFDQDVLPPPDIPKLLMVDGDIVAGAYPTMRASGEGREPGLSFGAYKYNSQNGGYAVVDINDTKDLSEIIHVDAVLGGCTLIKRKVLEDPRMHYTSTYTHSITGEVKTMADDEAPAVFRTQYYPNGRIMATEDIDFCSRAKKFGYTIKLHKGIRCGHLKNANLLDMYDYANPNMEAQDAS